MKHLRVLIIEDSENDTMLLLRMLRKGGFEPFHQRVQTEESMRTALWEEEWDLILSDHDMPCFSAPEALKVYRESGLRIPFIIVSGAIGESVVKAAMKAGAHGFVKKKELANLIPAVHQNILLN